MFNIQIKTDFSSLGFILSLIGLNASKIRGSCQGNLSLRGQNHLFKVIFETKSMLLAAATFSNECYQHF